MMRLVWIAALAAIVFCLASSPAPADDDHAGACLIEEWRADYDSVLRILTVEGVATCRMGRLSMRLYDGKGENRTFLGVGRTVIMGYVFEAIEQLSVKPNDLSITFIISPR